MILKIESLLRATRVALSCLIAGVVPTICHAAAITVADPGASGTVTNAQDGSTFGPATISGYTPGGNAIVVMTTGESVFNHSVTYDGTPLVSGAVGYSNSSNLAQQAHVWYLLNPAASGDLVIQGDAPTGGGTSGFGYAYFSLDGVGSIVAADNDDGASGTSTLSVDYTTLLDGSYVAVAGANNANVPSLPSNDFPTYDSGNASTLLLQEEIINTLGGSGHYAAHGAVPTAGSYSEVLGGMNTSRNAMSAVVFQPVPEPASLALLGLGIAGLAARRRS